jgi:ABC-type transporter Mla MlaB component
MARRVLFSGAGCSMLRISTDGASGERVRFRLDGQITGRWVKLVERTCESQFKKGLRVTIDLKNISFVDRAGIALLRSLMDRGVEILNALPFIAEQIEREKTK